MMNLLMAFILAFYFQKWHFMAFWDGKFGIPLAKNVGNTEKAPKYNFSHAHNPLRKLSS